MEEMEGIIVDGTRYDVRKAQETEETCRQCAFCERDLKICFFCAELIGGTGFFVKSEKLMEP